MKTQKAWTEKDLKWMWNYTALAMCWHVMLPSGNGLYMGRTLGEARESLKALNEAVEGSLCWKVQQD